jgi:hypothetical protein
MRLRDRLPNYITSEDITDYEGWGDYIVYIAGAQAKAMDQNTGKVVSTQTNTSTVINDCIALQTNGLKVLLKGGTHYISETIATGIKCFHLSGEGWGLGSDPTSNPGTLLRYRTAMYTDYYITLGSDGTGSYGCLIENLMMSGLTTNNTEGGIDLNNVNNSYIRNVLFKDFYNTTAEKGVGIYFHGNVITRQNIVENCRFERCHHAVLMKATSTGNTFIQGYMGGRTAAETFGFYIDGANGTQGICGPNIETMGHANSVGCYIKSGARHRFFGTKFEGNYCDIKIDAGGDTGDNYFIAPHMAGLLAAGTSIIDNGNDPSWYYNGPGLKLQNRGAATIVNGVGTIVVTHDLHMQGAAGVELKVIPTCIKVTGVTSGEMFTVGAIDDTNFTITAKTHANGNGTNQVVYWEAEYDP